MTFVASVSFETNRWKGDRHGMLVFSKPKQGLTFIPEPGYRSILRWRHNRPQFLIWSTGFANTHRRFTSERSRSTNLMGWDHRDSKPSWQAGLERASLQHRVTNSHFSPCFVGTFFVCKSSCKSIILKVNNSTPLNRRDRQAATESRKVIFFTMAYFRSVPCSKPQALLGPSNQSVWSMKVGPLAYRNTWKISKWRADGQSSNGQTLAVTVGMTPCGMLAMELVRVKSFSTRPVTSFFDQTRL